MSALLEMQIPFTVFRDGSHFVQCLPVSCNLIALEMVAGADPGFLERDSYGLTETKLFHFHRIFKKRGTGMGVQANPLNPLWIHHKVRIANMTIEFTMLKCHSNDHFYTVIVSACADPEGEIGSPDPSPPGKCQQYSF